MTFEQIADMGMGLLFITGANAVIAGCAVAVYIFVSETLRKKREKKLGKNKP